MNRKRVLFSQDDGLIFSSSATGSVHKRFKSVSSSIVLISAMLSIERFSLDCRKGLVLVLVLVLLRPLVG